MKFARESRTAGTGLWAYGENGTTKGDLDQVATQPAPSETTTNTSSAPAPSSGGTEFFANCTELRVKYPNGVASDHPAYQSKMDRDKDNYACER